MLCQKVSTATAAGLMPFARICSQMAVMARVAMVMSLGGIDLPAAVRGGVGAVGDLRAEVLDLPAVEAEQQRAGGGTADIEGENAIHVSVVARGRKGDCPLFSPRGFPGVVRGFVQFRRD